MMSKAVAFLNNIGCHFGVHMWVPLAGLTGLSRDKGTDACLRCGSCKEGV